MFCNSNQDFCRTIHFKSYSTEYVADGRGCVQEEIYNVIVQTVDWECGFYCCCFQVHAVVGVLGDDTDPMVTVMKLEKAPQETYADIGGLDQQIQEIKVNQNYFVF